jgi:hypothetical protein
MAAAQKGIPMNRLIGALAGAALAATVTVPLTAQAATAPQASAKVTVGKYGEDTNDVYTMKCFGKVVWAEPDPKIKVVGGKKKSVTYTIKYGSKTVLKNAKKLSSHSFSPKKSPFNKKKFTAKITATVKYTKTGSSKVHTYKKTTTVKVTVHSECTG